MRILTLFLKGRTEGENEVGRSGGMPDRTRGTSVFPELPRWTSQECFERLKMLKEDVEGGAPSTTREGACAPPDEEWADASSPPF